MYRVVQWATGAMGRTSLRRILDHPDLELAGVYVYGADKSGRDAGALARRPATGVIATDRIEDILALDADVVIHTPRITLPYSALNADVARLLASGKNVISTAGFHWPATHGADYGAPLLAAAQAGRATLAGLGVNPGAVVERIALAATGLCARFDRLTVRETVDASHMTSADFVFGMMGFGHDPAENDITQGPLAVMYSDLFGEVLALCAHALGTSLARVEPEHRLTLAPVDMVVAAGPIPRGRVAATEWRWRAFFADGGEMLLSILWTADPALHGSTTGGHWVVEIEGRPNIRMTLDIHEGDIAAPPARALTDATVAVAIRAIPDVCAAAPGFFAFQPTAPFRARL
jgi:hypothetical protein